MNKNSKRRLQSLRKITADSQTGVTSGKRVISTNRVRNAQEVVYTNKNEHGSASITRHEPLVMDKPMRGGGKVGNAQPRQPRRS